MNYPQQPTAPAPVTSPAPYAPPTPPIAQPEPQQFSPPQGPSWQAYPAQPTPTAPPQTTYAPQQFAPQAPPPYQPQPFGPAQYAPPMADSYQQPAAPPAQPNTAPPQYAPAAPAGYAAVQPGQAPAPAPAPAAPQQPAAYQYSPQQVQELEQFYAARQPAPQAAPAAPAAPEPKKPWASLDYDEELEQHGRWDADAGMYVPKGQYSSVQAVHRLNEIHAERQKRIMRLTTGDPVEIWKEAGGLDAAREAAAEVVREQFNALQRQQIEASFIEQNADKLYQVDQGGNILRHPDGSPALSPYGVQVVNTLSELESSGVADMRAQLQWLNRLVPLPEQAPPQQPAPPAWNPYTRGPNGNGNGHAPNGQPYAQQPAQTPNLFAPQQPYSPQQLAAAGQAAFAPYYAPQPALAPPTLAQQAAPPQYQPPSQQQLFLQRAEVAHAQQPGNYMPGTGGTLGVDPSNPYAAPQQPFNPEGGYLLKSAIAQGLIPDPRNNF